MIELYEFILYFSFSKADGSKEYVCVCVHIFRILYTETWTKCMW